VLVPPTHHQVPVLHHFYVAIDGFEPVDGAHWTIPACSRVATQALRCRLDIVGLALHCNKFNGVNKDYLR
jgi:hypothetical protein